MNTATTNVALLYDDSAYRESLQVSRDPGKDRPVALVGRQVAGQEFLSAYLSHGSYRELTGVVWNQSSADSLKATCRAHPRASQAALQLLPVDRFLERGGSPRRPLLHLPCPPDPGFAWMRRERQPDSFCLCGVTHTLASAGATRLLCDLLTAPFEPYDALICTSRAVVRMVRTVVEAYAHYLEERFGSAPALRPRLECIPLGVNPERFHPATPAERASWRAKLNIHPDATAVLFVGRFTPHAKAHPFPMFHGLAQAAKSTGKPAHLILSGWAANDAQLQIVLAGLRTFAPGLPVSIVNGLDPEFRFGVWHAADVFTSMADSIQETFGLVILEAMSSGLPVVATDWNGYRDLVVDGETGYLVPTLMVKDATADATIRLLLGSTDYDGFLAECNQTVTVDNQAAVSAYSRLLANKDLCARMGAAGRERVLRLFTWAGVVDAYELLWTQLERERQAYLNARRGRRPGPACYPAPEISFAGYPTCVLDNDDIVGAATGWEQELPRILSLPLCTYGFTGTLDPGIIRTLLREAESPRTVGDLADLLERQGVAPGSARARLAWLLKYGLLRRA